MGEPLNRLREKGEQRAKSPRSIPQGLKLTLYFVAFAARLKLCPVTKQPFERRITGFSAACKAHEIAGALWRG
jgi:hypothetical protein